MRIRLGCFTLFFLAIPSFLATNPAEADFNTVCQKGRFFASYFESELNGCFPFRLWEKVVSGQVSCQNPSGRIAVADLSLSSEMPRFYVVDVFSGQVLLQTWVAHGRNSGERETQWFSNEVSSLKSSLGFYRIGDRFESPKHGPAILLDGLDQGINDNARKREIILHGADYVGEEFIEQHGRCGRSHGCPALPREQMNEAMELLPPGSLLYVAGPAEQSSDVLP